MRRVVAGVNRGACYVMLGVLRDYGGFLRDEQGMLLEREVIELPRSLMRAVEMYQEEASVRELMRKHLARALKDAGAL